MVRMLPVEIIGGRKYFRDDRLREFRAVYDPHDRIEFRHYEYALRLKGLLDR